MDGFAVSERIERTLPRLARHTRDSGPDVAGRPGTYVGREAADRRMTINLDTEGSPELVDVHSATPIGDRWAGFRDRWSELTFYLFDPQSWR